MKRRIFIKNSLSAGAAVALTPGIGAMAAGVGAGVNEGPGAVGRGSKKKVIVAGAGITGLCCAYELMKAGHEVTVLEASGRTGGHVYTSKEGLADGLYADFGADHITKPGYEKFFGYVEEFGLTAIPYPNAEGSEHNYDKDKLKVIEGKIYTCEQLKDEAVLRGFGFNERELDFLAQHPLSELRALFLKKYVDKFTDAYQPFGVGYDNWDMVPIASIYEKEGASAAAMRFLGGKHTNALYAIWRLSLMYSRGIPLSEGESFHLKDGNEELPNAFAKKLGDRVRLKHVVTRIQHTVTGVTVHCNTTAPTKGEENARRPAGGKGPGVDISLHADVLVNCITLPVFSAIPVTPALSPAKQYVVDHLKYSSHPFYVFQATSKFWLDEGIPSINMDFGHPLINSIWLETNQVDTHRIILKAYGPSGFAPEQILAAFRQVYPGKKDTIEKAVTYDWSKDKYAPVCEMESFPIGEMHKFWPEILKPNGRIYFAGTYADNMSRGMESCIRSAQRVAGEIDQL
jgi:monoamine oxidase